MTNQRLPWRRDGTDAFIAYPDGDRSRYARIYRVPGRATLTEGGREWLVMIRMGREWRQGGPEIDKQSAADAATKLWWEMVSPALPRR